MEQLLSAIRGNFEELNEMLSHGDANQFEVHDAESFCSITAEIITLMEKNPKEMEQVFGTDFEPDLARLKTCAVAVYKSIPHLEKADEHLGSHADEIHEVVGNYLDYFENLD